jgi:hypothetical protein
MNTAFGYPEDLPFDLKSHSFPITYDLPDTSDPQRVKDVRKKLTDHIANALKPILIAVATKQLQDEEQNAAKESWTEQQWRTFQNQVVNEGFRGIAKGRPCFAIAIIPLKQPANRIDIAANEDKIQLGAPPLGATGWNTHRFGRSIVNDNSRDARHDRPAEAPTTATEVTDTGCVFAVTDLHPGQYNNGQHRCIPLQEDERKWLHEIGRYAALVRGLGTDGRFAVRMMLTDCHNMIMLPTNYRNYDDREFRPLAKDCYDFEPVVIGDTESAAVTAALRPSFNLLWRDAGFHRDPLFPADQL